MMELGNYANLCESSLLEHPLGMFGLYVCSTDIQIRQNSPAPQIGTPDCLELGTVQTLLSGTV